MVATLDAYDAETVCLGKKLQASDDETEKLMHDALVCSINVPVVFTGCGGQVEITEDTLVPDMHHAVLVHKDHINMHNSAIKQQAGKVLELRQICSHLRSRQQGIAWEISMSDLAAEHKAEHVKELQLFHVTREVQHLIDSSHEESLKKPSDLKTLEKLRDLNQRVQVKPSEQPVHCLDQLARASLVYTKSVLCSAKSIIACDHVCLCRIL